MYIFLGCPAVAQPSQRDVRIEALSICSTKHVEARWGLQLQCIRNTALGCGPANPSMCSEYVRRRMTEKGMIGSKQLMLIASAQLIGIERFLDPALLQNSKSDFIMPFLLFSLSTEQCCSFPVPYLGYQSLNNQAQEV